MINLDSSNIKNIMEYIDCLNSNSSINAYVKRLSAARSSQTVYAKQCLPENNTCPEHIF